MVTPLDHDPIIIVCGADNNYAMPLATMLCSVLANHKKKREVRLFVIDGDINADNKCKILDSLRNYPVEVHWIRPDEANTKNLAISGHITHASYYKVFAPLLLPADLSKAIYLDSDVIVTADIEDLWNQDVEHYDLLAVQDACILYVSSQKGLRNYKTLGLPTDRKYFNAGVLVLNLDRWRAKGLTSHILHFVKVHADIIQWHDQDGLNAVVKDIGELDPRWNQQIYMYGEQFAQQMDPQSHRELLSHPYAIHYISNGKPWNWRCTHPRQNLFFSYLDLTAWAGWRLPWWHIFPRWARMTSHRIKKRQWNLIPRLD